MLQTLPGIIERVLNLSIDTIEELKDDIQFTKERKTDLLKKVSDAEGNKYVLHVEYQTDDYPKMHYRMAEYSIMLQRKYGLPVLQYVIYIGPGKSTMQTTIQTKDLRFRYHLKAISSVDYRLFLKSDKLEERMLAFLGRMEPEENIPVLETVLKDIEITAKDSLSVERYVQQLRILVKLRNLGQNLDKAMITISKYLKDENDPWFIRGQKEGIQKGIEKGEAKGKAIGEHKKAVEMAQQMLIDRFPINQIAKYTGLSVEDIKALKS